MRQHDAAFEQVEYRLALVQSGSQSIWAHRREDAPHLPRISIPRWTRPVERIQQAIEANWNLQVIVLDVLPGEKDTAHCAVAEILFRKPDGGFVETCVDEICDRELTTREREAIKAILAKDATEGGQFSRPGWIQDAMEWISVSVGHDPMLRRDIQQFNAASCFALVRFAAGDGEVYWLKATGEPNAHEYCITAVLAKLCPEYLPRWIAGRKDWNAWLMEDAGSPPEAWTLASLENAVCAMARLQQRTIGHSDALLSAGAFDQRVSMLRAHLEELVEYLDEAMARQVSTKVPRVEKPRLREIAQILRDACSEMETLGIPDTALHNDINSSNILFRGTHCVFTDWCETGVGNPFFALQYLLLLQLRDNEDWAPRLWEVYTQCWQNRLSGPQIELAVPLVPILAILSYLYGRGTWLHSPRHNNPHVEGYARSLARQLDRAARAPQLLEALCH
jgi:hypothetical protein